VGNLETMRLGYAAWSRRDVDEMLRYLTEDIVMEPAGIFPGLESEYRGRDEFLRFMESIVGPWEEFAIEPVRLIEAGEDRMVGLVRFRGRGREGIEVEREFGHLIGFRDGRAAHIQSYESWDEVLAVAGVAE
jgi:ketosteroid isomerase-like protein